MRDKRGFSKMISGLAAGAALMYLFDPRAGRRRRAVLFGKLTRIWRRSTSTVSAGVRDVSHRAQGAVAEAKASIGGGQVADVVLVERVRSKLGRAVSHPRALEVAARDGKVFLGGKVLAHERKQAVSTAAKVRGVREVVDRLDAHEQPGDVPELQGGTARVGEKFELLQSTWSPAARLLVGAGGAGLAAIGVLTGGVFGAVAGFAGAAAFARAVTNKDFQRLTGFGGRRAVEVQKAIAIDVPVEEVFDLWSGYENFAKFMPFLAEVRDTGGGRSHWKAKTPAGAELEWDAVITRYEPNRTLAWRSEPGAEVPNSGIIHFRPGKDGTHVDIKIAYTPPAGAIGHGVAALLGQDLNSLLDDGMMRLKSLMETGKTTARGREIGREQTIHH